LPADETVIRGVLPDPEPEDPALDINAESAMMKALPGKTKSDPRA
jgi:hypothetical protein